MSDLLNEPATTSTVPDDLTALPCVYCRGPIPAETFVYWSDERRLLSATCPCCSRRVTLPTATWHRWNAGPGEATP